MIFKRKSLKDIEFPQNCMINGEEYSVEVEFLRKKNSSVVERNGVLLFRLSAALSYKLAQKHFESLLDKISRKLQKKVIKSVPFKKVLEKGTFTFAQEKYIITSSTKRGVRLKGNIIYYTYSYNINTIEKRVIGQLMKKYSLRIEEYVRAINAQTYNFTMGKVETKNVQSKWGHCTSKNDIMINIKLLNAPVEVFNYVIIHELAHVKHKNHSKAFWREVERMCPNYKKLRKHLKDQPPELFILHEIPST